MYTSSKSCIHTESVYMCISSTHIECLYIYIYCTFILLVSPAFTLNLCTSISLPLSFIFEHDGREISCICVYISMCVHLCSVYSSKMSTGPIHDVPRTRTYLYLRHVHIPYATSSIHSTHIPLHIPSHKFPGLYTFFKTHICIPTPITVAGKRDKVAGTVNGNSDWDACLDVIDLTSIHA